jgi:hypothetical protein
MDQLCMRCNCPPGFTGTLCEHGFTVRPTASCGDQNATINVTYEYANASQAPTQSSLIGAFGINETATSNYATFGSVCGTTFNQTINGGLCPPTGTVTINAPSEPGLYKLVLVPYMPPPVANWPPAIDPSTVLGFYTVVRPPCTT